jgi:putative tricarboxylic transport membrane protein
VAAPQTPAAGHRSRLVAYLFLAAACGGLFLEALRLPSSRWEPLGAGTFPAIVLGTLGGLCLLGVVIEAMSAKGRRRSLGASLRSHRLVIATFAAFAVYALLLPYLGFGAASFLFLLAVQLHLGPLGVRTGVMALALALLFSFGLEWLFANVFEIFLPRGRLWT